MNRNIKNFVLLFFCLNMLLCMNSSCEKPMIPDVSKAEANLVVTAWQMNIEPFPTGKTRAEISDLCSRLNYAIYDMSGKRVRQVNQQSGDEEYGTAYFKLPAGKYQVVVVGHSSNGNPTMTNPAKIQFKNDQGFTDTFLNNDSVTLDDDSRITLNTNPHRIVSLCRFVVSDPIPNDVARMRFQYKGGSGAFDASTGLGSVNSTQTEFFPVEAGRDSTTFDLYTFLHDQEGTIHLQASAYDANDNVLNEREFDVPLKRRKVTKLTGPYFTSSGASIVIIIGIDDEWEGEEVITY